MPTLRSLEITEKFHRTDGRSFDITTEHGWLETVYRADTGQYLLANLQSTRRREGIGQFLLRASFAHAQELEATHLTGYVISRECIDAISNVFGPENLEVSKLGEYGQDPYSPDSALALFYYSLDKQRDTSFYKQVLTR